VVYWKLDNSVYSARFLTEHERRQAVERLRANQTGISSSEFEWKHVSEALTEPKTYLWLIVAFVVNVGTSVTNTFGPLILNHFGYDRYFTSLLNMPSGALQIIFILIFSYGAQKAKIKGAFLLVLVLPVILGLSLLYLASRTNQALLLSGYYLLASIFGPTPLAVSWIIGNTAGTTKKSFTMSFVNMGISAGNIVGPLLFSSKCWIIYLMLNSITHATSPLHVLKLC
jgi:hypothetical protein